LSSFLSRSTSDEMKVIEAIDYRKDVDGFHPINVGSSSLAPCLRPCTPAGIQEMLIRSGNDPGGRHVVIVGRSNLVGKPVLNILLQKQRGANAVATIAHTGPGISPDIPRGRHCHCRHRRPGFITGSMLKPGCTVIDVGINRIPDPTKKSGTRIIGMWNLPRRLKWLPQSPCARGVG